MDIAIGFLTFGTLGFVAVFAYVSARVTEKRRQEGHPPSSLAARKPVHVPRAQRG
jgi:hypothetical protein